MRLMAIALGLSACGSRKDETCTCTPGNVASRPAPGGSAPLDGPSLVAALRRHKQDVANKRTPRDIKIFDDELRFAIIDFCSPCGSWVSDRHTMEEMFPLDRLDEATSAVCMGLVLRDGSTVYGSVRCK